MRYLIVSMIFASLVSICCTQQESSGSTEPVVYETEFAKLLDSLRVLYDFPALAGAIITSDSIIEAKAVGCRKYGGSANVTDNDLFHIGSNSKAFTATLIGILIDNGLLEWESTLVELFPELTSIIREEYRNVTIINLLSHTSGLMANTTVFPTLGTVIDQRYEVVEFAVQSEPAVQKGDYLYSNLGYIIAGAVIEKLLNRSYEELIIEMVAQPLGITTMGFGSMGTPGMEDQPLQHIVNNSTHTVIEPSQFSDNPPIYSPAGRIHLSIGDWAKFIKASLAAEEGEPSLLNPETSAKLTDSFARIEEGTYYGLGWVIVQRDWADGKAITHAGSNTMNYSVAWMAPNKDFAILAATNQAGDDTYFKMDQVAARLIEFYLYR